MPVIVRGDGARIWDDDGREYLDGLAGLFVVQVGHGRKELAEAAAKQASELAFFPIWSYAHPPAIELAERLANLAPGDLEPGLHQRRRRRRESAWKLAKQFFKLTGQPMKTKVISRNVAYHGTRMAPSASPASRRRRTVEPLVPEPQRSRTPTSTGHLNTATTRRTSASGRLTRSRRPSRWRRQHGRRGVPRTGAEPGLLPTPPGYFERVREICDRHDVLLVADETICAFGRIGETFAIATTRLPTSSPARQGAHLGYAPMGAMIASDRLFEPFAHGTNSFLHGFTWGGHPVAGCGRPGQPGHHGRRGNPATRSNQRVELRSTLENCETSLWSAMSVAPATSTASVVRDKVTRRRSMRLSPNDCCVVTCPRPCSTTVCTVAPTIGDPVIQLAPPLIIGQPEFDEIEQILRHVLTEERLL